MARGRLAVLDGHSVRPASGVLVLLVDVTHAGQLLERALSVPPTNNIPEEIEIYVNLVKKCVSAELTRILCWRLCTIPNR